MKKLCLAILLAGAAHAAVEPASGEAEELLRSGKLSVQRKEYTMAMKQLERAAALAPRDPDYQHWLGNSYAWAAAVAPLCDKTALGRKCLAAYQRTLALDPDHVGVRLSLVNFYRHVPSLLGGGVGRAREQVEEIRRRDPAEGRYALALLHWHEKKWPAAFAALAEVLRQKPEHYAANFLFGRVALASGERIPEGRAALRHCLTLAPSEADESHETVTRWLGEMPAAARVSVAQ